MNAKPLVAAASAISGVWRLAAWLMLAALAAVLAWRGVDFAVRLVEAILYPFELDYGEGIVLQQALLITGPHAYGDITREPFIVFHYPPVYLLVVRAVAALGVDIIVAGRAVSALASLALLALVFLAAYRLIGDTAPPRARAFGALAGALLVAAAAPFAHWAPFARVDMLAVAFSLGAIVLAAHAGGSPLRLHGAVLLAVAAVFTKQTSIAASVAIVLALLLTRPRRGIAAMISGLAAGLVIALAAIWLTDGGFLLHLVLYNVNRFAISTIVGQLVLLMLFGGGVYALQAGLALALGARRLLGSGWTAAARRVALGDRPQALLLLMLAIGFCVSTALLALTGKRGSSVNYAIEWFALSGPLIGLLIAWMATPSLPGRAGADAAVPPVTPMLAVLALPFLLFGPRGDEVPHDAAGRAARAALVEEIRAAPLPVISDDMVLLLRAGRTVPWEPAIFAELAQTGIWDERLIVDRIRARRFAFILTDGERGERLFDSRYNPAVAQAIAEAYPRRERRAGLVMHRPSN